MNVRHAVFFVFLLSACPKKSEKPEEPIPSQLVEVKPQAVSSLPQLEGVCTSDDDCTRSYTYLVDGKCCTGTCSPKPASKADLQAIDRVCASLGFAEQNCPAKKCVAPPKVSCVSGRCAEVVK